MMHAHRLLICLVLVMAWCCQTDSDTISPNDATPADPQRTAANVRLKQLSVTGSNGGLGLVFRDTYFIYSEGRQLAKVTVPTNTMSGTSTYEYTYDDQGRVKYYQLRNEFPNYLGIIGKQGNLTYRNGAVEEIPLHLLENGETRVSESEPKAKITYRYNDQGQITEQLQEGIIIFGSETSQRMTYTYENGNMVKLTMLDAFDRIQFTITYDYDDKINPFYQMNYLSDPVIYCSRNNVISSRVNDNAPSRKEFTYNEQGLPLTQTYVNESAVLTYEYESF